MKIVYTVVCDSGEHLSIFLSIHLIFLDSAIGRNDSVTSSGLDLFTAISAVVTDCPVAANIYPVLTEIHEVVCEAF